MELLKVFQIYGGHLVKFRTNVVSIFKETKLFHNVIENYEDHLFRKTYSGY